MGVLRSFSNNVKKIVCTTIHEWNLSIYWKEIQYFLPFDTIFRKSLMHNKMWSTTKQVVKVPIFFGSLQFGKKRICEHFTNSNDVWINQMIDVNHILVYDLSQCCIKMACKLNSKLINCWSHVTISNLITITSIDDAFLLEGKHENITCLTCNWLIDLIISL